MQQFILMENIKPIVLVHNQMVVPAQDMLRCLCRVCANEVNWRHKDSTYLVFATCCCHVYWGVPAGKNLNVYKIQVEPANMKNVSWMFRQSALEETPAKR